MEKKKILIVDDVPENLTILYKLLSTDYEVIGAKNGAEALTLAVECRPDIILLDIMMPEMDGYEVCRILKAGESTRMVPVIFVTALAEEADEEKGFEIGAVDYVTKPIKPTILKHRIKTQLDLIAQQEELRIKNSELEQALRNVKELSGLLPICMICKKIRDDKGYWNQLESYISKHSKVLFNHGICPVCYEVEMKKL